VGSIKRMLATFGLGASLVLALVALPMPASAGPADPGGGYNCSGSLASFLGLQNWDACLSKDDKSVPQFRDLTDVWRVAVVLIQDLFKIAGYLAVGYFIWGSFKYVKSQGEPSELTQSRTIITHSIMGLVIVLISIAIVQFIAGTFT
jgi:hypothetical protein